jgi:transcriptional regulator with XRE-family HTH domain
MGEGSGIGDRVRRLRTDGWPRLTQRELAEKAGVSVELVSKLEQGVRQSARLATLTKIARALDVDVADLVSRPVRVDTNGGEDSGVLAVRRAVITLSDDAEPAAEDDLRKSASLAWGHYWSSRFDILAGMLPEFIGAARATVRQTGTPAAYEVLSDAYRVAATMLAQPLGKVDLAYLAMERAVGAAEQTGDELRRAAVCGWMSWLLTQHAGSAAEAVRLAVREADAVEPRMKGASPEQVSVWGTLLGFAAIAAARDDNPTEADDLVNLAEVAATRLDGMGWTRSLYGQAPFGLPRVVVQMTDIAVVTGRPGRALTVARKMPPEPDLPLDNRAHHLADVALALTELGKLREAENALHTLRRTAPKWMTYQSYPRRIVAEMWERDRRARSSTLLELAEWMRMPLN